MTMAMVLFAAAAGAAGGACAWLALQRRKIKPEMEMAEFLRHAKGWLRWRRFTKGKI